MINPAREKAEGVLETLDANGNALVTGRVYTLGRKTVIVRGETIFEGTVEPQAVISYELEGKVMKEVADYKYRRRGIQKVPVYLSEFGAVIE